MTASPRTIGRADLPTGLVTFLFTDIEGSTRLSQKLGDAFAMVIDRHHAIMREAFAVCGGTVVSTEGDAFFAVFIDPPEAVRGAVTAQRALSAESWPAGVHLRVRMGLHTGTAQLGGDNYAGMDVNRAARISGAGHGGQVLLSGATAAAVDDALPGGVGLRDLGEVLLKDIERPEPVFQVDIDGLSSEFPPLRADRPGWLPDPLTTFLGRGPELTAIAAHVEGSRLVTLTGPGGSGKTRLSIEAARTSLPRFPGGAWFVPLESIRDPDLVLPEIAERLEVQEDPNKPLIDTLAEHIGDKRTLIVLDNLEQVVDAGPELGRLLAGTHGMHVLGSSREALRIVGEQEYPVPMLDEDLAVLLFVERARKVRPDLTVDGENEKAIRRIVARLDYLPLAVELAAARVRLFAPPKLLERLEARLEKLSSGNRDLPERQRTLRGAIEWSWELLDAFERSVFGRLAIFAGGAEFEAAEAIVDPDGDLDGDTLDAITSLAEKSLVRIEDGPGGEPRVRMLETIREYAVERLTEDPGAAALAERHALHFLDFAEKIEPELMGTRAPEAFARMEAEHDNIRTVIEWSEAQGRPGVGLRIGGAVWRFWQQRAHIAEGIDRLQRLYDHPAVDDDLCAKARGATGLGGLYYWRNDFETARTLYEDAVDAYRNCGDEAAIGWALFDLAYPVSILGDVERARQINRESLELFTSLGDEHGIAVANESLTTFAIMDGKYEEALALQEAVVAAMRVSAGTFKLIDSIGLLAIIEARLGMPAEALEHFEEASGLVEQLGDRSGIAGRLQTAELVALANDRPDLTALVAGSLQVLHDGGAEMIVPSEAMNLPDPAVAAREQLGAEFELHFEAGRGLAPEDAIRRLRSELAEDRG